MTPTLVLVTGLDNYGKEFSFHVVLNPGEFEGVVLDRAFEALAMLGTAAPQEIQAHI